MTIERETYYRVRLTGAYQEWRRDKRGILTEPRPFVGWLRKGDWSDSVDEERPDTPSRILGTRYASAPPDIARYVEKGAVGPWWYTVTGAELVRVRKVTAHQETVLDQFGPAVFPEPV